ncbi:AAA family ATPase [Pacificibacter marinus]|nr:AAA family ATPase [Pacificibacter marinus]MBU2866026.1 AAA family ATPase [Pacificibacter marinus]
MPRIKFIDATFPPSNLPSSFDIESRLKRHLHQLRLKRGARREDFMLTDTDRLKIERRAASYLIAIARKSGMGHLDKGDRKRLEVFRKGAELKSVETDHHADVIASALHAEMPWMAKATERVWHDMRASVRNGDPAPRLRPLLLVGPPGIGKSFWARLLGDKLLVPTTVIEATGEPAAFSVTGSQRGWGAAGPGKPLEGIMASGIANPVIVVDEIEKAGIVASNRGQRFALSEGLLPFLEPFTAVKWSCPYFRVSFDMSWISWVMTANSLDGLPAPFLSRCPPMQLSALSAEDLKGFASREGARRGLSEDAVGAVHEVIDAIEKPQLVSLRSVVRMLDAVDQAIHRPLLH